MCLHEILIMNNKTTKTNKKKKTSLILINVLDGIIDDAVFYFNQCIALKILQPNVDPMMFQMAHQNQIYYFQEDDL